MKSQEGQREIVFFLAGFLLGVLYIYFMGDKRNDGNDFFSLQNLMQIQYMEVVQEEYLLYLVKKRLGVLLVLLILSLAIAGQYLLQGFLMLLGCSVGSMLSILIVRYGAKGMLLFFGLIFPQDLVYIPVLFGWVLVLSQWNAGFFGKRKMIRRGGMAGYDVCKRIMLLGGVTIIGILLECYVNLYFVKWVLKFF